MGQKYVTFEKRLTNLVLFSLAKQQLNDDLTSAHRTWMGIAEMTKLNSS